MTSMHHQASDPGKKPELERLIAGLEARRQKQGENPWFSLFEPGSTFRYIYNLAVEYDSGDEVLSRKALQVLKERMNSCLEEPYIFTDEYARTYLKAIREISTYSPAKSSGLSEIAGKIAEVESRFIPQICVIQDTLKPGQFSSHSGTISELQGALKKLLRQRAEALRRQVLLIKPAITRSAVDPRPVKPPVQPAKQASPETEGSEAEKPVEKKPVQLKRGPDAGVWGGTSPNTIYYREADGLIGRLAHSGLQNPAELAGQLKIYLVRFGDVGKDVNATVRGLGSFWGFQVDAGSAAAIISAMRSQAYEAINQYLADLERDTSPVSEIKQMITRNLAQQTFNLINEQRKSLGLPETQTGPLQGGGHHRG